MYIAEEDRQEAFIIDVLPEVVYDKLVEGTKEDFLEALSYDGYHAVHHGDDTMLDVLRVAIAEGNEAKVGGIIVDYVTQYTRMIAYDEIDDDLAAYGYEFDRNRR